MMLGEDLLTIFTPTYNRKYTLERLFISLKNQTNKKFKWIIVDDGSTDDSISLLEEFKKEADFDILLYSQKNKGKHIAINKGVMLTNSELFFIVDSDDFISEDAVELIYKKYKQLSKSNSGLCFRKYGLNGNIIGKDISNDIKQIELSATEAGDCFQGDLAYIFKTEVMKKHPFPFIKGEIFVPELYIWNKLTDEGKVLCIPSDKIYFCEYMHDGYSFNFKRNLKRNPIGFSIYYKSQIKYEKSVSNKIKRFIRYVECQFYRYIKL